MFAPNARICKPQNINKGTGDLDFMARDLSLQFGGITSLGKKTNPKLQHHLANVG